MKSIINIAAITCSIGLIFGGCTKKSSSTGPIDTMAVDTVKKDSIPVAVYPSIPKDTSDFSKPDSIGSLSPTTLREASGLAASRNYPGLLWTHNDSGNPPYLFLIDSSGTIIETFELDGVSNRDWEDIASGPGPTPGVNYVYVGEIGDNNATHSSSYIYRVVEPSGPINTSGELQHIAQFDKINFVYPDGPHNAETLMLDPITLDLYVVSKLGVANVYLAKYPQPLDSLFTMDELATLPLYRLTGGDISSAASGGSEILMCSNDFVYYWKRTPGESVVDALLKPPVMLPYGAETQGEAICWSINNDAYFTTSEFSENVISPLYIDRRK